MVKFPAASGSLTRDEEADWWVFSDVIVCQVAVVLLDWSGMANQFYFSLLRAEFGYGSNPKQIIIIRNMIHLKLVALMDFKKLEIFHNFTLLRCC